MRAGAGRVLVIRGDPGIGKTALLDDIAESHPDVSTERIVGAEAEAGLAFAGVQRLVLRHKAFVDELPAPQRHALRVTIGSISARLPTSSWSASECTPCSARSRAPGRP